MTVSLYLVNPCCDTPAYFGADVHAFHGFDRTVLLSDVALPTIAAMAPADFDVTLCDEGVSPVDMDSTASFVGITGKISQEARMIALAREFRARGKVVIFGGPYASLSPERLRAECDILVRGEMEDISDAFFADLRSGAWQNEYIGGRPDLTTSPTPRWDLYPNQRSLSGTLQTSRGCPFECEFCDVIQYLGRKQRHKNTSQVLAELDVLYRHDYRAVFLADDNFTVFRARTRELLTAIRDWNDRQTHGRVAFTTQVSIDCARDDEIMRLCGEAGLANVFIGIETPNTDSLKETKKRQNVGIDMVRQVERFPAHGISVTGGMMVGFDADTPDIFVQQYAFAMSLPVPIFTVTPLSAPMATPLHARLKIEGRLVESDSAAGPDTPAVFPWTTNIVPRQMSREELASGVRWLCNRLYRPAAFEYRVARFIDLYQAPAPRPNAVPPASPPNRAVDAERVEVCRRVTRLGAEEAAMAARLQARLARKPGALPAVLLAFGYYMQIRHIYETSGLWDPALGRQEAPFPVAHPPTNAAATAPVVASKVFVMKQVARSSTVDRVA